MPKRHIPFPRCASLLALAPLMAAPAAAADLALVLHGTVQQTLAPVVGPLAGATVGDRFVLRLVVDAAPTVLSGHRYGYGIRLHRGSLTIEDEVAPFDGSAATTVFWVSDDEPGLGDSIDVYCGLGQSDFDLQLLLRDPAGALLSSPSLAAAVGALAVPAAGNLAQLVLRDSGQNVTTVAQITHAEVVDLVDQPGENLCVAANNASGRPARIAARGSAVVAANTLVLDCTDLPTGVFGYFLASRDGGFVVAPGGSQGTLCLGGAIGRYAGDVQFSGAAGAFSSTVELGAVPQPSGAVAVVPGDTWRFQCWYRDFTGASPTSNFSDAVWVRFE
jgi:hypothetical protein